MEKLLNQIIEKAIPIFEVTHPGCIALFAFDNATSHAAFADDALVASKVNWKTTTYEKYTTWTKC